MPVTDIRISTKQPNHPKTRRLIARLGYKGYWHLMQFYCCVAVNKPDGRLPLDPEEVEMLASWDGEPGEFCRALTNLKLIDKKPSAYVIHDWKQHNPWVATQEQRSAKAKKAAEKRWNNDRKKKWKKAKEMSVEEIIKKNR